MLTSVEKVESYLGVTFDEPTTARVEAFIEAVTAYVERYTGRTFAEPDEEAEATELIYDGNDGDEIFIDDATEITGVKIGDDVLDATDYVIYPANRLPKTRIILPYRRFI